MFTIMIKHVICIVVLIKHMYAKLFKAFSQHTVCINTFK